MQKWGKRPIYFKNAEIMQNALIMQTLRPLKYWKSCKIVKIAHSELFWTTSVGKYWKCCKMAKIGHSESIQTTSVGKYWKS